MVRRAFLMAGTGASFIMLATLAVFNLYGTLVEQLLGVTGAVRSKPEWSGPERSGAERSVSLGPLMYS